MTKKTKVALNGTMHNAWESRNGTMYVQRPRRSMYESTPRAVEYSMEDFAKLQSWEDFKAERDAKVKSTRAPCQICGGEWAVSKGGQISHHGYRRPGGGWQTASCLGARHAPYTESRDRIPFVIRLIEKHTERLTRHKEALESPDFSEAFRMKKRGKFNFKTREHEWIDYTLEPGSAEWDKERYIRLAAASVDIGRSEEDLARFNDRFANWPGPSK